MEEYNQGKYFLTPFSSLLSKLRECLKSKHYIFIAEHKQLRLQRLWKLRLFLKFPQKGSMVFRKMVEATYLDIRSHRCTFVYFLVVTKRWQAAVDMVSGLHAYFQIIRRTKARCRCQLLHGHGAAVLAGQGDAAGCITMSSHP